MTLIIARIHRRGCWLRIGRLRCAVLAASLADELAREDPGWAREHCYPHLHARRFAGLCFEWDRW